MGCVQHSAEDVRLHTEILRCPDLQKPTHMLRFQGHYVATEINRNQLAIFDDLSFSNMRHFDPRTIGQQFQSPHFLSLSPWGTLLISNGWGASIVEITDLEGRQWHEFSGLGLKLNAPHGICVDEQGWIYVGDSLNSRIVRFRDMAGSNWEIFSDIQHRVAYSRQLVWHEGTLWVANSYERRPGLNPGKGASVLRIEDFSSGQSDVVFHEERASITGILPIGGKLYVAIWGDVKSILSLDLKTGQRTWITNSKSTLGVPYGLFYDSERGAIIAACFGDFEGNHGGLLRVDMHHAPH